MTLSITGPIKRKLQIPFSRCDNKSSIHQRMPCTARRVLTSAVRVDHHEEYHSMSPQDSREERSIQKNTYKTCTISELKKASRNSPKRASYQKSQQSISAEPNIHPINSITGQQPFEVDPVDRHHHLRLKVSFKTFKDAANSSAIRVRIWRHAKCQK